MKSLHLKPEEWLETLIIPQAQVKVARRGEGNINSPSSETISTTSIASTALFLGQRVETDQTIKPLEIYSNPKYISDAISSLLSLCQNTAKYFPAITTPPPTEASYSKYVGLISESPFFINNDVRTESGSVSSKNYDGLIDSITSVFEDIIGGEETTKVISSVKNLAKNVFSEEKTTKDLTLFSQVLISMKDSNKQKVNLVCIASTKLKMMHEKNGKTEVSEQNYTVSAASFVVADNLIHAYADKLADKGAVVVNDWLGNLESLVDKENKVCIENKLTEVMLSRLV